MNSLRRTMIVGLSAVLGGFSAVAVSACSEDNVLGDGADQQVELSLTERDLAPGRVRVNAGEVEFVVRNDGDRLHAFAVETPDGVKRTEDIEPGEKESVTVDLRDGKYRMYDPRGGYRRRGVSGTVVVDSQDADTVTERTVERTVVEEAPEPDLPEVDDPEVQDPEVQEPAAPPPPVQPPPTVTKTVPAPPPPPAAETTP